VRIRLDFRVSLSDRRRARRRTRSPRDQLAAHFDTLSRCHWRVTNISIAIANFCRFFIARRPLGESLASSPPISVPDYSDYLVIRMTIVTPRAAVQSLDSPRHGGLYRHLHRHLQPPLRRGNNACPRRLRAASLREPVWQIIRSSRARRLLLVSRIIRFIGI